VMSTASNSSLKQSCSALTSATTSALEVNFNVMRSMNSRLTYLLTYLLILCATVGSYQGPVDHEFESGMKLEAVNPQQPGQICVATITSVLDNRLFNFYIDHQRSPS